MAASTFCKLWFWPLLSFIFCLISIGLAIALIAVTAQRNSLRVKVTTIVAPANETDTAPIVCGALTDNSIDLTEPSTPGPFHDLTSAEIILLREYLESHPDIKASKSHETTVNSSYIFSMDLMLAKKKEVLDYLNGVKADVSRSARVIMFRGDKNPPVVEDWKCGPLPNIYSCQLLKVSETGSRNPVEFSLRPFNNMELSRDGALNNIIHWIESELSAILKESYNATFMDCANPHDCLTYSVIPVGTQLINNSNTRSMWLLTMYNVPYHFLHPLGLTFLCHMNGADSMRWNCSKVWYADKIFSSVEEFKSSYYNNSITKIKMTRPIVHDNLFSTFHRRGDPQPQNPQRPPTEVEPDGKRYALKNRKVNYLSWDFNFRLSPLSGPALYDVRFKGERIAYEISVSELAVFYSGTSPWPQLSDFVDSGSLVGLQYRSLVAGGDCPDSATFINQTFYNQNGSPTTAKYISFCLFEHNSDLPLRRHLSYSIEQGGFYGGMSDSALILRTAITVVNYDYIVDFIFHQNGAMQSRIYLTGYIQSNYYRDVERLYGFRISEHILGNLHHHMIHFKVDLDINGTTNRYQTLDIEPDLVKRADDPNKDLYQTKIARNLKTSERNALYTFDSTQPKYHIVFSNATKQIYNEHKGYRIQIEGPSKHLLPEDVGNERTIPWARHQMAVTKQKDSELRSSSIYAMFDSATPVINFTSFYSDDENIVDEDLVLWVTCGMYHVPRAEDLPVTTTLGTAMGFDLLPFNYYTECPSMSSPDAISIHHVDPKDPKKGVSVIRHSRTASQCVTPKSSLEDDVTSDPELFLEMKDRIRYYCIECRPGSGIRYYCIECRPGFGTILNRGQQLVFKFLQNGHTKSRWTECYTNLNKIHASVI
ncbi:hypothetical protein Btru_057248 [Bulinus truncatus]|nr:hypothetical protein Btru_057248 [Bulinus truncatus]